MSSLSLTPCIQPNPDISGIGVRASIYAQAFLSLACLFIFVIDGEITSEEGLAINDIHMTNELTASALLVSAVIQARTYGLSIYHANIVLILSWINFVPTYFIGAIINALVHGTNPTEGRPKFRWRKGWKGFLARLFQWIHYIAVAGFGIWVWSDVGSFGDQPQCTPQTFVVIFGFNILVTNPGLKIAALILYSFFAFVGIVMVPFLTLIRSRHCERLLPRIYKHFQLVLPENNRNLTQKQKQSEWMITLVATFSIEILFVFSTEVLIRRSKGLVYPGESQWTFGQSLAISLVLAPLAGTIEELQKGYQGLREKRKKRKESQDDELPMINHES